MIDAALPFDPIGYHWAPKRHPNDSFPSPVGWASPQGSQKALASYSCGRHAGVPASQMVVLIWFCEQAGPLAQSLRFVYTSCLSRSDGASMLDLVSGSLTHRPLITKPRHSQHRFIFWKTGMGRTQLVSCPAGKNQGSSVVSLFTYIVQEEKKNIYICVAILAQSPLAQT